ncbi:MAG: hypothetical protein LBC60_11830 [Spirochaetaceae bacterium]|jgi:hypothetical protein|nr:hypothetical protein [Spirochaetaceae bacterium]
MKRQIPFVAFAVLIFLIVLIPIVLILLNLPTIITWFTNKPFIFGGNTLVLVVLIPVLSGFLVCLGMAIISREEEKYTLAAHELLKRKSPGVSGEKELREISALIEAINGSLERLKDSTKEIIALSKKITPSRQDPAVKVSPASIVLEMPVTTESLKIMTEKINQTIEYRLFTANADKFKTPILEKDVLYMLINRLKNEQDFNFH